MMPHERDALLLEYLDGRLSEPELGRLDEMVRRDPELSRRLAELALNDAMIPEALESARVPGAPRMTTRRDRPVRRSSGLPRNVLAAAAAAAAFVAALAWFTGHGETAPAPSPVAEHRTEKSPSEKRPPPGLPPPEEPRPEARRDVGRLRPEPPSLPTPAAPLAPRLAEVPSPEPPPAPSPPPPPAEPPRKDDLPPTRVVQERPPSRPARLGSWRGGLSILRGGRSEAASDRTEISSGDLLSTGPRRGASFEIAPGSTCWLDHSSSLALERTPEGVLHLKVHSGTVFLRAAETAVVSASAGEVKSDGASFQVGLEKGPLQLVVLEGSVQAQTPKGEQTVRAGQRSTWRPGERPSAPAKADAEAATAWTRAPALALGPPEGPYLERESGGNRRLSGLVVTAPYSDGEESSGRLARAVAETADVALVLGHAYRDPKRRLWINVDRGMEGDVSADGSVANERFTDRARRATAEFLEQCRLAAGVPGREPVPVIVQFRTHYLKQSGAPVDVAEVALAGWPKSIAAQMKGFYAQLLDKHRPSARLELKVQGLDDTYDYRGTRRKFSLGEDDAREEGYMAPRNAHSAIAVFLPEAFGRAAGEIETYARVFAELSEFLSSRRR